MPGHAIVPGLTLVVVFALMVSELFISRRHERHLRARGAAEPPDDVYPLMQWAYPGSFVVMAVEGWLGGPAPSWLAWSGGALFVTAKALKVWTMVTLGRRWTYRVLVLPGAPLVTRGPYAFMRHPNYVAVLGELAGVAALVGAPFSGPPALLFYTWLLRRKVRLEERAHALMHRRG